MLRAPRATARRQSGRLRRLLLTVTLPVLGGFPAGMPAQSPVQVTGTRTNGLAITMAYGLSYEIAEGAAVTWSSVTDADYAVYDLYSDTASWTIRNRGTVGTPANGASPYNGIYLKTTGSSTVINEATGYITTGLVTGETRAAVNFERGWGWLVNKGNITGASTGAILGVGGVVENTGTIIGQNASRSGIWFATGNGVIRNTGGYIEGGSYGIRMSSGTGAEIWNANGGVINAVASSGDGIGAGNAGLSVTNDAAVITAVRRGIYYTESAGPGIVNNINGGVITGTASAVYSYAALNLTNGAGSLLEAFSVSTGNAGIYMTNAGLITLTNAGTVSGGVKGINLGTLTGHTIVNESGGVIRSIYDYGAPGSLASGQMGAAISQSAASGVSRATISNAGLIEGQRHGIFIGNEAVINNTGTIRATGTSIVAAIYFSATNAADSLLGLGTGSVLDGDVISSSTNSNRLVLQGSGAEDSNFVGLTAASGFKSLTMEGDDWALSGTVSLTGTGAALRVVTGTLAIASNILFRSAVGGAAVEAGATLRIADGASLASAVTGKAAAILTAGDVIFDRTADFEYNGNISGTGSVRKVGDGTLTLSGSNTYGDTIIKAGTLKGNIGRGDLVVDSAGTYDAGVASEVVVSGLAGDGTVTLGGAADLVFDVTGGTSVFDFAGTLNGGNKFIKTGTGVLDLRQTLTMANGSHIQAGVLLLDDAAKLGAGSVMLGDASARGMIEYTGAADWTKTLALTGAGGGFVVNQGTTNFTGTATGEGDLVKSGDGALDITNANMTAHTGDAVVEEGTLKARAASINGNAIIDAGAVLEFYQTTDDSYSGVISGSGSLHKTGDGALILAGANTYGDTLVRGGLLEGSVGMGALMVDTGGTYRMAASSSVSLAGLQGDGVVDLNGNALSLNVGDGVTGTFAFAGAMTGGGTFEKTGGGVLVLSSTISLGNANIKEGAVRLTDQAQLNVGPGGTISLGGISTRGFIEYANTDATDWEKNINLVGAGGGFIINQSLGRFRGTTTGDGRFVKSGSGTLDITGGVMTHTGGVAVDAGTLRGNTDTITDDAVIGAGAVLEFYQATDGVYSGTISGAGALHKTGAGRLDIGTAEHFYGDTLISAGLLEGHVGVGTLTVGISGTYKMDAGSSVTFTGIEGDGTVDLNGNNLCFDVAPAATGTFAAGIHISNGGLFIKTGEGTLDLQQTLSMTNGSFVKNGAIRIDDAAKLGAGAVTLGDVSTHGMIEYTGASVWEKNINLAGDGGGFIINQSADAMVKFTGTVLGSGDFVKSGSGTLDITDGVITHTGGIAVDAGTLKGNTDTITGDAVIGADAVLEFYQATDGVYSGTISGSGALHKTGAGLLDLGSAAHAYGDTSIESGIIVGSIGSGILNLGSEGTYRVRDGQLAYASAGIMGTGTIDLNQADLVFDIASGTNEFSFSGVYTGAGGNRFVKKGAGTLNLLSHAMLPGGSAIEEGVVCLPDQEFLGEGIVLGTATTAGFLEFTGSAIWTKAVEVSAGGGGFVVSGENEARFAGAVSGDGIFIKDGSGRLDSTGASFGNTGGISVRTGTLAGDAQCFGGAAATVVASGAMLEFNQTTDATCNGMITGAGSLHKTGAGVLTVTRVLECTGTVISSAGVLRAGAQDLWFNAAAVGTLGDGAIDMGGFNQRIVSLANDGAVIFNAKVNSIAGVIYEMDSLQVTGSAAGGGKIRVNIDETVIDGAAWIREATFFEITGAGAPNYTTEIAGRHVSGAYDWVITPSSDRKRYALSADQLSPEVPAVGGIDSVGYLAGKASVAGLSRRLMMTRAENASHDFLLWTNGLWREDRLNGALYHHAEARTRGLQLGGDWNNKKGAEKSVTIGAFYDYAETDMNLDRKTSSTTSKSNGVGLYASYRPAPAYIDLIVRSSKEDYDIMVPGMPAFSTEGTSIAASIEAGGVLPVDWSWNIEPQLQAMLQRHKVDNACDSFGREYTIDSADTIEGRFGVRLWREISVWSGRGRLSPYARASFVYEWEGEGRVTVAGRSFCNHMGGSFGSVDAGVSLVLGRHCLINADGGWYAGSKMNGYAFNAGLGFLW